jgi:hypothetical protein
LQSCKESPALQKYGSSAAVFLISQVGKDAEARKFLDELRKDGSINGMVYCSAYTLDDQQAVFKQGDVRKGYTAWVSISPVTDMLEGFYDANSSVGSS